MKKIRLSPDYFCSPIWAEDYSDPYQDPEITPETLSISKNLVSDIWLWAYEFDATLNLTDPSSSGFKTEVDEMNFKTRGRLLADRLQAELGSYFSIEYHDK